MRQREWGAAMVGRLGCLCRCLMLVTALAVLGGCATVSVAKDPSKEALGPTESAVVLSVTGNTARVSAVSAVTVRRVEAGGSVAERFQLQRVIQGIARDTALFVGALPSGEYEIERFDHFEQQVYLPLTEGMRGLLGRFKVAGRTPVDLGRLVLTPHERGFVIGRSASVGDNAVLLQRYAPSYAKLFAAAGPAPQSGWSGPRGERDKVEEYAQTWPEGISRPVLTEDGRVLAGSRLGNVLERASDGRWRAWRGPGLVTVMDVLPVNLPDARLLAVGELSTLWRLPPGGGGLVPVDPGNLPAGNLLFAAGNEKQGWYLGLQSGPRVLLLRSSRLEAGDWQVLREESAAFNFWSGASLVWFWRTSGGLAYATSKGELHFLDFASGQWTVARSPKGDALVAVQDNPDGSLGVLSSPGGGFAGVFAGVWRSTDLGRNWQEIKTPFKVNVRPPLGTSDGKLLVNGGVFGDPELQQSLDGGQTWTRVGAFPVDRQLYVLSNSLYLRASNGAFGGFVLETSKDQGLSWQIETHTGR